MRPPDRETHSSHGGARERAGHPVDLERQRRAHALLLIGEGAKRTDPANAKRYGPKPVAMASAVHEIEDTAWRYQVVAEVWDARALWGDHKLRTAIEFAQARGRLKLLRALQALRSAFLATCRAMKEVSKQLASRVAHLSAAQRSWRAGSSSATQILEECEKRSRESAPALADAHADIWSQVLGRRAAAHTTPPLTDVHVHCTDCPTVFPSREHATRTACWAIGSEAHRLADEMCNECEQRRCSACGGLFVVRTERTTKTRKWKAFPVSIRPVTRVDAALKGVLSDGETRWLCTKCDR